MAYSRHDRGFLSGQQKTEKAFSVSFSVVFGNKGRVKA
jgi:hypothetical protein